MESILHRQREIFESGNEEPIFPERTFGSLYVLKLARLRPALAATLAVSLSMSEIPFLDSCVPD
ncbi:MAG: hypothetical protein DMF08_12945 [Verrucomicrobia bacterium]|nr:MAG: hypothetical protein DMF08_12945 [Verrucomicrobiota bacterium]